jgi:hypothetical protein
MSKTLSKGTLGLRFMQNAQRAKQQDQAGDPEQAKVHDDGAWEISKDIRDAWGIDNQPTGCESLSVFAILYLNNDLVEESP